MTPKNHPSKCHVENYAFRERKETVEFGMKFKFDANEFFQFSSITELTTELISVFHCNTACYAPEFLKDLFPRLCERCEFEKLIE